MSEIDDNFIENKVKVDEKTKVIQNYGYYFQKIIPNIPTQNAVDGIKFDFNFGIRFSFPPNYNHYKLICKNADNRLYYYNNNVENDSSVVLMKKYLIKYDIEIKNVSTNEIVFKHKFDLENKDVLIAFPVHTLGDSIAWFSYIEKFQKKYKCNVYVLMNKEVEKIFYKQYPNLNFISEEDLKNYSFYATYYPGLFMNAINEFMPLNYKYTGLHKAIGMILGLRDDELKEEIPRVDLSAERKIKEKYVVIATHSTSQCKHWNNPEGWYKTIKFLKENGYKVICIDKYFVNN